MSTSKTIQVIGVPMDHGAGRRGVGMGPAAIRIAGLHKRLRGLEYDVRDLGDLQVPIPETLPESDAKAKFLPHIADTCVDLANAIPSMFEDDGFPLVLGGDHSIAIGTLSGLALEQHRRAGTDPVGAPKLGVIWFDAHGDINRPETSPSGNIHGMPVSCLLGQGPAQLVDVSYPGPKLDPGRFCQIGLRDIDAVERRLLLESGIHTYTMSDIDRRGMVAIMEEAMRIAFDGSDMVHCSFDIDSVDPRVAPGTGTPKLGGLTYREAHLALEMLAETGRMTSMEMVEVNPTLDDQNKTAELAVELIASALGSRIL
ncbi:MAG: arginase [Myxococcota bacterium]